MKRTNGLKEPFDVCVSAVWDAAGESVEAVKANLFDGLVVKYKKGYTVFSWKFGRAKTMRYLDWEAKRYILIMQAGAQGK